MLDFEAHEFEVTSTEAKAVQSHFGRTSTGQFRVMAWVWVGIASSSVLSAWLSLSKHGNSFSVGLAFLQVATAALMIWNIRVQRKGPRILPAAGLHARVAVAATGLSLRFAGGVVDLPWRRIERVVALEDAFVFVSRAAWRTGPVVVLPRRVLAPGEAERLWTFIDDHLTAKRGIVRGLEFARPTIFNTLAQKR